jgi:hypothetical protein
MSERVYVAEYGTGARPAKVVERHEREGKPCMVVEFTDDRGGGRDCFATSVFDTPEAANAAAS